MSLVVILKNIQGLKCKGEKVAKVDFRGMLVYNSKFIQSLIYTENIVFFFIKAI